jgi:thermitase
MTDMARPHHWPRTLAAATGAILLLVITLPAARAADSLTWHKAENRMDADVRNWPLPRLLEEISSATGWQVFLEPGTTATASSKFKNLPTVDALRRLLGDLNFALLPQTNGSPRLLVFKTSAQQATQRIQIQVARSREAKLIPDELLLRLKPGANIDEIARKLGAKVVGKIDSLNAYRLKFDDAQAASNARAALAGNPDVASIDNNYSIGLPPAPMGLAAMSAPGLDLQLKPPGSNGRLIIGLVDTAIQSLGGNLDAFIQKPISLMGEANPDPSSPTHATTMADALIAGLKAVTGGSSSTIIQPVDVYGNSEDTSLWSIASGIVAAINAGANIVNVSSGAPADSSALGSSFMFTDLVRQAQDKGIVINAAAGNSHDPNPVLPAAVPGVNAVTASDSQGNIAGYANYADYVRLMTPGSMTMNYRGMTYLVTGTSVSSALASGVAAGLAETSGKSVVASEAAMLTNPSFRPPTGAAPSGGR